MFSIMIVDDEKAIRENLSEVINFEEYGFKICGIAKNGEDALSKLPQCCPDVIFLDVCMPVMDGLAFLQEMHKMQNSKLPYVVMLSGYSDFEYARTAIRYGVKAYLTKPVDEEEISLILTELKEDLQKRTQTLKKTDMWEQVKLLKGMYHSGDGDRKPFQGYQMMHCVVLKEGDTEEETWHAIRELVEERIPGGEAAFCRNQGSILSYLLESGALESYQQNVVLFARHLLHQIKKKGITCAVLFDSTLFEKSEGTFRNDYDAHLYQMLTEVFWGNEVILQSHMLEISDPAEGRMEKEEEFLEGIKNAVCSRNPEGLKAVYESIVETAERKRLNILFLQEVNYRIYYRMTDLLAKENVEDVHVKPLDLRDAACFMRFGDWKEQLWQQLIDAYTYMENKGFAGKQGIGEQALVYIRNHFREQISLQTVADQFYVSASYLGKCIQKSSGGGNFRQYLSELRIEEAKRLLRTTDKLIYEVAEETGFTESKYFISKFVDQTGMSPAEYRKMEKE